MAPQISAMTTATAAISWTRSWRMGVDVMGASCPCEGTGTSRADPARPSCGRCTDDYPPRTMIPLLGRNPANDKLPTRIGNSRRKPRELALMTSARLGTMVAMTVLVQGIATPTIAQSLDYGFYKARVEPIFLAKRPEHVRCYDCHSDRSNHSFRLPKNSD